MLYLCCCLGRIGLCYLLVSGQLLHIWDVSGLYIKKSFAENSLKPDMYYYLRILNVH